MGITKRFPQRGEIPVDRSLADRSAFSVSGPSGMFQRPGFEGLNVGLMDLIEGQLAPRSKQQKFLITLPIKLDRALLFGLRRRDPLVERGLKGAQGRHAL